MRRFGRILLNAATVLSLALCAAAAVMWVRSHRHEDHLPLGTVDRGHVWTSGDGALVLHNYNNSGFSGHYAVSSPPSAIVPYWGVVLVSILLPSGRAAARVLRRRAADPGRCPVCGYDLRATPDRCPECGATPPAEPARPGGAGG